MLTFLDGIVNEVTISSIILCPSSIILCWVYREYITCFEFIVSEEQNLVSEGAKSWPSVNHKILDFELDAMIE